MMKKYFIILALLSLVLQVQAFNLSVTNYSDSYIKWEWDSNNSISNVTGISLDGIQISNVDPKSMSYIANGLGSNEIHALTVYITEDNTTTSKTTTMTTAYGDNTWGYLLLVLLLFLLGKFLHWSMYFFGSGVSLYGLVTWIRDNPIQNMDIWHLPLLIFGFLFVLGFVLWALRKRK